MRRSIHSLVVALVWICSACSPGKSSGSESGSSTGSSTIGSESSSSVGTTSGSGTTSESESDTGDDEPPEEDMCPADPELLDYRSWLDDAGVAIEVGSTPDAWTHRCTVVDHSGEPTTGEYIELDCLDEAQQPLTHTIELLAEVAGGLSTVPVELGQAVELQFWISSEDGETMAWVLRDTDQGLLVLHYDGRFLPSSEGAVEAQRAPPAELLLPVSVGLNLDVCPLICVPTDEPGGSFVPQAGCCEKETALLLDVGAGPVQILNRSAAQLPGDAHGVVGQASYFDLSDPECVAGDESAELYQFMVLAQ